MKDLRLAITCDGSGDATVTGERAVHGFCYAVSYQPGTIATGGDLTITTEGLASIPLLVKANAGTSNVIFYPRVLTNLNTDGSATTE
jgi:hypothetical protein